MNKTDMEIVELKARLKELSASKFKRFNALLLKDNFKKLNEQAKDQGISKAKLLNNLINKL